MDRAYESNQAGSAPAPPNPPILGYPSETAPATVPGAWWFHMITEELRAIIVAAALAPDATKVNQVAAAISAMIAAAIQAAVINWAQIENVPSNTGAVANTLALRDGSADLTAAGFNVSSDVNLKEEIKPIERGALDRLDLWGGITYRHKGSSVRRAGVPAQAFAKARPESVRKDKNGRLMVDVMAPAAELAEALREEREARRALEARIVALEARR